MWKGIKGGRKSNRQPLLRNDRAGRWVAFKLSIFSSNTWWLQRFFFFLFPFKLPFTLHISKPWTLPFSFISFFFFLPNRLECTFLFLFLFFFSFLLPLISPLRYIFKTHASLFFYFFFFSFFQTGLNVRFFFCFFFFFPL